MDASEREQYRAAIHGDREAFEMLAPWVIAIVAIVWIAKRVISARQ